jgi:hypothetical protein
MGDCLDFSNEFLKIDPHGYSILQQGQSSFRDTVNGMLVEKFILACPESLPINGFVNQLELVTAIQAEMFGKYFGKSMQILKLKLRIKILLQRFEINDAILKKHNFLTMKNALKTSEFFLDFDVMHQSGVEEALDEFSSTVSQMLVEEFLMAEPVKIPLPELLFDCRFVERLQEELFEIYFESNYDVLVDKLDTKLMLQEFDINDSKIGAIEAVEEPYMDYYDYSNDYT